MEHFLFIFVQQPRFPVKTPAGMNLQHAFTHFLGLGGVQTILKFHLREDTRFVNQTSVIALLDRLASPPPGVKMLGKTRLTSSRMLRKTFLGKDFADNSATWIYYNFWGAGLLADVDQAVRRIGYLHSSWPGYEAIISAKAGLFDGILCVDEAIRATVLATCPTFPPARVRSIPFPIKVPPFSRKQKPKNGVLRIGFSGRIEIAQKRIDRIPEFLRLLDSESINWEFRAMGEGASLPYLQKLFREDSRVEFLGRLSGDHYWRELLSWDAIVFFSDYEGVPVGMLEGISLGVLPIYPSIGSGGDSYVERIHPSLLYKCGDLAAAASAVSWLSRQTVAEIENLKARAVKLVEPHSEENYLNSFHEFVRLIESLPPVAVTPRRKIELPDLLPLSAVLRLCPSAISKRI